MSEPTPTAPLAGPETRLGDLARAYSVGLGPESGVGEVATPVPCTAAGVSTVLAATRLMLQHHVRHLVITGPAGDVVGVVSLRALARILMRSMDPGGWACLLDAVEQL